MPTNLREKLRTAALALPDTTEGIACAGTSLQKRSIKVGKKAFLFLGTADAMLKLEASLPEAEQLAAVEPERYQVGAHGWTKIMFDDGKGLTAARLVKWVKESYQLFAPAKKKR
jgi:predicted DNA-binding protein (MmcQ/YjbR family)